MLATALALVVIGAVLGLFFPVMFVASLVGVILLIVFFVGATRRATTGATGSESPAPDRPE
jgi:uncharacterized membrane protein